jgi:hypothetical protein
MPDTERAEWYKEKAYIPAREKEGTRGRVKTCLGKARLCREGRLGNA